MQRQRQRRKSRGQSRGYASGRSSCISEPLMTVANASLLVSRNARCKKKHAVTRWTGFCRDTLCVSRSSSSLRVRGEDAEKPQVREGRAERDKEKLETRWDGWEESVREEREMTRSTTRRVFLQLSLLLRLRWRWNENGVLRFRKKIIGRWRSYFVKMPWDPYPASPRERAKDYDRRWKEDEEELRGEISSDLHSPV